MNNQEWRLKLRIMTEITDIHELLKKSILDSNLSIAEISRKSGIEVSTIRRWVHDIHTASIDNAQCVLSVIGKELTIRELKVDDGEKKYSAL